MVTAAEVAAATAAPVVVSTVPAATPLPATPAPVAATLEAPAVPAAVVMPAPSATAAPALEAAPPSQDSHDDDDHHRPFPGQPGPLVIPVLAGQFDFLPIDIVAFGQLAQPGQAGLLGQRAGLLFQVVGNTARGGSTASTTGLRLFALGRGQRGRTDDDTARRTERQLGRLAGQRPSTAVGRRMSGSCRLSC